MCFRAKIRRKLAALKALEVSAIHISKPTFWRILMMQRDCCQVMYSYTRMSSPVTVRIPL